MKDVVSLLKKHRWSFDRFLSAWIDAEEEILLDYDINYNSLSKRRAALLVFL